MSNLYMVSPVHVMHLWEQLMQCVYRDNSFGTTVAEIYLYTVMPRSPLVEAKINGMKEEYLAANRNLYDLCKIFEERVGVKLYIDSGDDNRQPLDVLLEPEPYTHRVHIGVY